jgi:O-antigen ligase
MSIAARGCLLLFLAAIAVDWPQLPLNMRAADIVFIAAALAVAGGARPWMRPRLQMLDAAIAVYLAGSVVSVIFSPDVRAGAVELIRQAYLVAIYAVVAIAVWQGLARTVATGLALSGGLLAAAGLAAAGIKILTGYGITAFTPVMMLPYIGETVRLRALTASEAMLACVLAVSVPFALRHPVIAASRARVLGIAVLYGAAAALTFSHSIAGIAVALVIAGWRDWLSRRPVRLAAAAAAILIVLAFNFAASISIRAIGTSPFRDDTVFHYAVDRGRTQIAGVNVEYQTMSYLRIKQVAWDAFLSRPLVGIGLNRFHTVTEAAFGDGRLTAPYRTIDPHSTFVGRFAEAGIVGGVTLFVLWLAIGGAVAQVLRSTPDHSHWIAVAAAAAIAGTLINTMNADVMNFRFLWVVLGLVRGLAAVTPKPA